MQKGSAFLKNQTKTMKEINQEVTTIYTAYQAEDGTIFKSSEECKKYESSARAVLLGRLKKLIVANKNEWDLLGGMDDHTVHAVKLTTKEDANTLLQFLYLECPWFSDERRKEIEVIVDTTQKNKEVILLGENCEGTYYFINSRQNIIEGLNHLTENK